MHKPIIAALAFGLLISAGRSARAQVVVYRPWFRPYVYRPVVVAPIYRPPIYGYPGPYYRPWGVYHPWVYRPGVYRRW